MRCPEGQRTSSRSTTAASPSPKCATGSVDPAKEAVLEIWRIWRRPPAVIVIIAPIPSRLLFVPSSFTCSQCGFTPSLRSRVGGGVEVRGEEVEVAVAVEVDGQEGAAALDDLQTGAALRRDLGEAPVAAVSEDRVRLPEGGARVDLVHLRVGVAVGHEEVAPPVVVQVGEGDTPAQREVGGRGQSAGVGDVGEDVHSVVAVERVVVVREVGHRQVEPAVAVVVGLGDPHPGLVVTLLVVGQSRDQRGLDEGAVSPG